MEKLYTIPVNEAFDACLEEGICDCPFCRLESRLHRNELELILGASMMEPDVRIKTNASGFCSTHYAMMLRRQKRLPLALMLQSHLDETRKITEPGAPIDLIKGSGTACLAGLGKLEQDCYVCNRVSYQMNKMLENAAWLYEADGEFRKKSAAQPYLCLPHYRAWLKTAKEQLSKKAYADFTKTVGATVNRYFDALRGDVDWFVKKFDYRYDAEPWGNAKDSVERAIKFLSGDRYREEE